MMSKFLDKRRHYSDENVEQNVVFSEYWDDQGWIIYLVIRWHP